MTTPHNSAQLCTCHANFFAVFSEISRRPLVIGNGKITIQSPLKKQTNEH